MKTHPSENDNHESSRKEDLQALESSPSKITGEFEKSLNLEYEVYNSSESDSLIICSPELAARFQSPSTEKHKLNPGHYLHKVLLNSVSQKFKSQSLPNCFEKKKFQKKAVTDTIDELHETSIPLVESNGVDLGLSLSRTEANESTTNQWFKTWPERVTDKVILRNPDDINDDNESITLTKVSISETRPTSLVLKRNEPGISYSEQKLEPHPKSASPDDRSDQRSDKLSTKESQSTYASSSKENISNVTSVNVIDRKEKTISNRVRENYKTVPLEDLLTNISLAYSPVTKQLHLIQTDSDKNPIRPISNNKSTVEHPCAFSKSLNLEENAYDKVNSDKERLSFNSSSGIECERHSNNFHRVNTEVSSFSSTVSSLSDNSPSTTNEDSALGSLLDHGDTCSLVSVGACSAFSEDSIGSKPKKKSLTGFFSKNVFNWKSGSRSEENTDRSSRGTAWRLFGKNSSPQSSQSSLTVESCNEKDAWSLAPDSPCSVRSSSSGGPKTFSHESRVASSSALIQMDRPANLPAKSEEEEARHRQEYQQMVEAARKKELKESKQRKKQLQLQHKVEDQLAHATRVWTRDILQKWDQMHSSKKAQELWWQGVPPCVRGKVWKLAIGNSLNLTHSLYDICVQRAQDRLKTGEVSCSDEDNSDNKEASMQVIQLDISRTFPHLCIFQKGGPYYDMLHCLLAAYVCYRPDVGYVQGMSFIAAVLILNMEAADAFVCFANLLDQPCHKAFFHLNQPLMQAYYFTYNELFKENLPLLYDHFTSTTLTPDLYLLDWLYTVFTKAMNLDLASRVWDVFLRDGEEFLFRTALGVLHLFQDNLIQMDFIHGSQFLTRLPDDLSGDLLFKSIACIKMTVGKQTFESILRAHSVHCH